MSAPRYGTPYRACWAYIDPGDVIEMDHELWKVLPGSVPTADTWNIRRELKNTHDGRTVLVTFTAGRIMTVVPRLRLDPD